MSQGHADAVVAALMRDGLRVLRVRVDELQEQLDELQQLDELRDRQTTAKLESVPAEHAPPDGEEASGGGAHSLKGLA
jgi:hypothetical protein